MKRVLTRTTYLEMLAPVATQAMSTPAATQIKRLHAPTVDEYRALYCGVGETLHWTDRMRMPDAELLRTVRDEAVEIHVLYFDDRPAGYVELDRRVPGEIEVAYFGLFPGHLGKGLGKYFLAWAVTRAWSYAPRRVWVHTCDLDHPRPCRII